MEILAQGCASVQYINLEKNLFEVCKLRDIFRKEKLSKCDRKPNQHTSVFSLNKDSELLEACTVCPSMVSWNTTTVWTDVLKTCYGNHNRNVGIG